MSRKPLRIAVLLKQVPRFEAMQLGTDGRLVRAGLELEMNPYCRRAVTTGVELATVTSGRCTVFTLGPPSAEDVLREAIAWGAGNGVLITDPAFAGSDTLATARALAAALELEGPFDLVLAGRNSVDADTGQVGPQLAELLGYAFVGGARTLELRDRTVHARLEYDDGWATVEAALPAVVSCAERLCEPCKVDPSGRAAVAADRIRVVGASDLGSGPWGEACSRTRVGAIRVHEHERKRVILTGSPAEQADQAAELLAANGSLLGAMPRATAVVRPPSPDPRPDGVVVVVEPGRPGIARELLGAAASLATASSRRVTAIIPAPYASLALLGGWGADHVVLIDRTSMAADVAAAIERWCRRANPWAVLVPSTMWGREVAGRLAARLDAGLTGDATGLELQHDRLVGWKPAFGGHLVAAITATSPVQLVTVRPGVLAVPEPREVDAPSVETLPTDRLDLVRMLDSGRDDDVDTLALARVVVGIGAGVPRDRYAEIEEFARMIGGTVAATRKVTDREWMPRARQIGITGRSIQPDVYIAIGLSGRFNHLVGVRAAGTVVAINIDPNAPVFAGCDIGIVADWAVVLPLLAERLVPHLVTTSWAVAP